MDKTDQPASTANASEKDMVSLGRNMAKDAISEMQRFIREENDIVNAAVGFADECRRHNLPPYAVASYLASDKGLDMKGPLPKEESRNRLYRVLKYIMENLDDLDDLAERQVPLSHRSSRGNTGHGSCGNHESFKGVDVRDACRTIITEDGPIYVRYSGAFFL